MSSPPDTPAKTRGLLAFGSFELDLDRRLLYRDGSEVAVDAKPLAVLIHLVRNAERYVTKSELRDAVWGGVHVSDAALGSAVRDLRRALGDQGPTYQYVSTVRGKGYRMSHAVVRTAARSDAESEDRPDDEDRTSSSTLFVGREDVVAEARGRLADLRNGRGFAILLAGEAGIGKTAAASEIAAHARSMGYRIHWGRCLEEDDAPSWWPWTQVLRSLETPVDAGSEEVVRRLLGTADAFAASEPTDPDAERFRIIDAAARWLCSAAQTTPRVVVLDDLHRADASSLRLLRHMLHELPLSSVLIVGTFRDTEVGPSHGLEPVLDDLPACGRRFDLEGLSVSGVADLVRRTSERGDDPKLAEQIHERTRGHPLFSLEIIRALEVAGSDADPRRISSPGLAQLLRARIARLAKPADRVLSVASVLGREFERDILAAMLDDLFADLPAAEVGPALDAAAAARLLEEHDAQKLAFAHALVRDQLYAALEAETRFRFHAAAARAIERVRGLDLAAELDALAHHFLEAGSAGDPAKAVEYARRAAEAELGRAGYAEATRLLRAALGALDVRAAVDGSGKASQAEAAGLRVDLGRSLWLGGDPAQARQEFERAAAVARGAGETAILARAALGYAGRTDATPGVDRKAVALLEEALDELEAADSALRSELLARLGSELHYDPDPLIPLRVTRQAVAMAERLGDDAALAYALSAERYAMMRPETDPRSRVALSERIIEAAQRSDARDTQTQGRVDLSLDLFEAGELARLSACIDELGLRSAELRQPFFVWMHSAFVGLQALLAGRLVEADRLAHETLAIGQEVESPNAVPVYGAQLFCIRREQGRLGEMVPLLQQASEAQPVYWGFRAGLAAAHAAAGDLESARRRIGELAKDDFEALPRDQNWLGSLCSLPPALLSLGDEARARALYALLAPCRGRLVAVGYAAACQGSIDHHLGLLALAQADLDLAVEHFEAACALLAGDGAPLFLAHSRLALSQSLSRRALPADRERSEALAREAGQTYRDLGLADAPPGA